VTPANTPRLIDSEPPQPQDLVVTLLGAYVRPFGDTVWSGGLVVLLAEFGFSQGASRVALTRLVRRGLISRVRSGRLVFYRMTPRCDRLLAEGDGRIFSLGKPKDDGSNWTTLLHQIPEDRRLERSRLSRRLRFLGFGSVQDSVWISPHDHASEVQTLLDELEVSDFATVFVSRASQTSGLPSLVSRAWDLTGLAERYEAFCCEFLQFAAPARRVRMTDAHAFRARTRLIHLFRVFPQLDPELPEELAPLSDARGRAASIFHEVYERLAEPSQRYFEGVTSSPLGSLAVPAVASSRVAAR
jgi:phenylacetic acid degradation operon negative regulatory protein